MIKAHFDTFAGYNTWANARLYDAVSALPEADYKREGGAFFGSLHATLNHLLGTDRVWFSRCAGIDAVQGPVPTRLDCILFDDFAALREARVREDAAIKRYVRGLPESAYSGVIRYRRVSTPDEHTQPLLQAMGHWFNHQTHHRGQAHALLTQWGGKKAAPELDLLFYTRAVEAGQVD